MAGKPQKSRPNVVAEALSDEQSGDVQEASRTIGYARASPTDPAEVLAAQTRDLKAAGAEKVFSELVTGRASRPKLAAAFAALRQGDTLIVTKPDRLARSTAQLLVLEAALSERGIGLVILSMGGLQLDTREPTGRRMLTILAGVATWQREALLGRERQREGIAKARAQGRYKGRAPSIDRAQIQQLYAKLGPAAIARKLGIARSSVYRLL